MATSSVAIPSTRRAWRGHFTFHFPAAISRIPNNPSSGRWTGAPIGFTIRPSPLGEESHAQQRLVRGVGGTGGSGRSLPAGGALRLGGPGVHAHLGAGAGS